jgi:hypothetical protein
MKSLGFHVSWPIISGHRPKRPFVAFAGLPSPNGCAAPPERADGGNFVGFAGHRPTRLCAGFSDDDGRHHQNTKAHHPASQRP